MSNNKYEKDKLKLLKENKVSMTYFLSMIVGINHPQINGKNLTHNEVKELFPALKRASFDNVIDNPNQVLIGDIIMVEDSKGNVVPYFNPHIELNEDELYFGDTKPISTYETKSIPDINIINLDELNVEELVKLLRIYSNAHINSAYRKVYKELASRPDSKIANRKSNIKKRK